MTPQEELAQLEELDALERKAAAGQSDSAWADAKKYGPGFLKEAGSSILRGAGNMGLWAVDALSSGTLDPKTLEPVKNPLVAKGQQALDEAFPKQDDSYFTRAMEGAGGMAGGGTLKDIMARIMAGITSGTGAKAGGEFAGNIDPRAKPAGELVGGVFGGLVPAAGLTGQHAPEAIVRRTLEGSTPAEWLRAAQNIRDFQGSGAQTATLVDALNSRPRLTALGNELNMSPGGEGFSNRVAGREQDLQGLGTEFLNRVNPREVNPGTVANQTADSAASVLENARNLRSTAYRNSLDGVNLTRSQAGSVHRNLLAMARNPNNTDDVRAAYQAVADRMLRNEGRAYITNLQDLGLNLKALKRNPPLLNAATGSKIDAENIRRAIVDAEAYIGQVSPQYQRANDEFSAFSQQYIRPLREGQIGTLAGTNPNAEKQAPVGRLDSLLGKDSTGRDTNTTLFNLRDPSQTQSPVSTEEIARAVYQRQLDKGSTDPGQLVRGNPGSPADARLEEVLNGAGLNVPHVTQPLRAADNMQNFKNPPQMATGDQPRSLLGAVFTPFRRGEFELTKRARQSNNEEISALLANPTEAGLRRLQEIAQFDPNVRRMIATQLMVNSANSGQGE